MTYSDMGCDDFDAGGVRPARCRTQRLALLWQIHCEFHRSECGNGDIALAVAWV